VTGLGATPRDWLHFDIVLGLGADLLPVAPADSIASPSSKVKKWGKIPSGIDREGFAHGLKDWPTRVITDADIARWSADDRLSMCMRLGTNGIHAIDVDVTDPVLADRIAAALPNLPRRQRGNSSKFLLLFRLAP
jgi:hypothetical protein